MFNTFFVYVSVCVWLTINILAMASVAVVSTRPCVIVAAVFSVAFFSIRCWIFFALFLVMATAIPACFTRFTAFGIIFVVVVGVGCLFFFSLVFLSLSLSVSFSFYNSYNCNGPFLYHIEQRPGHTPEHFLWSFYDWYSQPHGLRGMFSVQRLVASCVFTRQFFFTLILNVCLVFCVSRFSFLIHTLELTLFRMQ